MSEKHSYGCLLAVLPKEVSKQITDWSIENIPNFHLTDEGRDLRPHVTLRYGFTDPSPETAEQIKSILANKPPIQIRLGKLSLFTGGKDGSVLHVVVDSPQLHQLHDAVGVLPHEDTHPTYNPHLTLAYLQPEVAQSYLSESPPFLGKMVMLDQVEYSAADKTVTLITLGILPRLGMKRQVLPSRFIGRKVLLQKHKSVNEDLVQLRTSWEVALEQLGTLWARHDRGERVDYDIATATETVRRLEQEYERAVQIRSQHKRLVTLTKALDERKDKRGRRYCIETDTGKRIPCPKKVGDSPLAKKEDTPKGKVNPVPSETEKPPEKKPAEAKPKQQPPTERKITLPESDDPVAKAIRDDVTSTKVMEQFAKATENTAKIRESFDKLTKQEKELHKKIDFNSSPGHYQMRENFKTVEEWKDANKEYNEWTKPRQPLIDRWLHVRRVISKTEPQVQKLIGRERTALQQLMRASIPAQLKYTPDEGLKASDGSDLIPPLKLTEEEQRDTEQAIDFVSSICDGGLNQTFKLGRSLDGRAGYMAGTIQTSNWQYTPKVTYDTKRVDDKSNTISLGMGDYDFTTMEKDDQGKLKIRGNHTRVMVHELGHLIEWRKPEVRQMAIDFINYRTKGDKFVDMGTLAGGVMKREMGRKNHFDRHFDETSAYYVGKVYEDKDLGTSTEVISMGMEALYKNPGKFLADDPEYFKFIVSVLRKGFEGGKDPSQSQPQGKKSRDVTRRDVAGRTKGIHRLPERGISTFGRGGGYSVSERGGSIRESGEKSGGGSDQGTGTVQVPSRNGFVILPSPFGQKGTSHQGENFTGQDEDSAGRKRCYQDGKLVPCPDDGSSGSSTKPKTQSKQDKLKAERERFQKKRDKRKNQTAEQKQKELDSKRTMVNAIKGAIAKVNDAAKGQTLNTATAVAKYREMAATMVDGALEKVGLDERDRKRIVDKIKGEFKERIDAFAKTGKMPDTPFTLKTLVKIAPEVVGQLYRAVRVATTGVDPRDVPVEKKESVTKKVADKIMGFLGMSNPKPFKVDEKSLTVSIKAMEGGGGTCKQGERSDLTGCTPASGEAGQNPKKQPKADRKESKQERKAMVKAWARKHPEEAKELIEGATKSRNRLKHIANKVKEGGKKVIEKANQTVLVTQHALQRVGRWLGGKLGISEEAQDTLAEVVCDSINEVMLGEDYDIPDDPAGVGVNIAFNLIPDAVAWLWRIGRKAITGIDPRDVKYPPQKKSLSDDDTLDELTDILFDYTEELKKNGVEVVITDKDKIKELLRKKLGESGNHKTKAMSWLNGNAGGALVKPPAMGKKIPIRRNKSVPPSPFTVEGKAEAVAQILGKAFMKKPVHSDSDIDHVLQMYLQGSLTRIAAVMRLTRECRLDEKQAEKEIQKVSERFERPRSKGLQYASKAGCKPGERSDLTGCVPAKKEGGDAKQGKQEDETQPQEHDYADEDYPYEVALGDTPPPPIDFPSIENYHPATHKDVTYGMRGRPRNGRDRTEKARQKRKEVANNLIRSKVIDAVVLGGGRNMTQIITLENGGKAVFKPRSGEGILNKETGEREEMRNHIPKGNYYQREVGAYIFAEALGFGDLVPVTVAKEVDGEEGSAQQFIGEASVAMTMGQGKWDGPEDLTRAAVFDFVTANTDRHAGNWLVAEDGKLRLIDNGFSFPNHRSGAWMRDSFIVRNCYNTDAPIPQFVKTWGEKEFKYAEDALYSADLSPAAVKLTMDRMKALRDTKHTNFKAFLTECLQKKMINGLLDPSPIAPVDDSSDGVIDLEAETT